MKNLILIIAILVSGTVNAQSFKDHKDLLANVDIDSSLSSKGFVNSGASEIILMSYLNINEKATTYVNDSTGEIVKISKNNVEYLYDGDKVVRIDSRRFELTQNLLYVMTKKIEGGWNDNPLAKIRYISPEDTDDGLGAMIIRKLGKVYIRGYSDREGNMLNSLLLER